MPDIAKARLPHSRPPIEFLENDPIAPTPATPERVRTIQGQAGGQGSDGKSAYEIAVENGFVGTEVDWLDSLRGRDGSDGNHGNNGNHGRSAYDIAVLNGFTGTEQEWLESLRGSNGTHGNHGNNGESAYQIAVRNGFIGTESQWLESLKGQTGNGGDVGAAGASAYQVAVRNGFVGTEVQWLASLHGRVGDDGNDGRSAYQIAVSNGFVGSETLWLASLKGPTGVGQDGRSAYQVAVANGFSGNEQTWLASLRGPAGVGETGPRGNTYEDVDKRTSVVGAVTLNIAQDKFFDLAMGGNITISFTGATSSARTYSAIIAIKQTASGNGAVSWPATCKRVGGTPVTQTTAANALDIYSVFTYDGGATYILLPIGQNIS